jgi:hypothetical protein
LATAEVDLEADAIGQGSSSGVYAGLTNGRRADAIGVASSSGVQAQAAANIRAGSIGKVSDLTQGDVTGALYNMNIEDDITLPQAIRLLLAIAQGDATGLDGNPVFKSLDGSKIRIAGTRSGGTRTITTRDAT